MRTIIFFFFRKGAGNFAVRARHTHTHDRSLFLSSPHNKNVQPIFNGSSSSVCVKTETRLMKYFMKKINRKKSIQNLVWRDHNFQSEQNQVETK